MLYLNMKHAYLFGANVNVLMIQTYYLPYKQTGQTDQLPNSPDCLPVYAD